MSASAHRPQSRHRLFHQPVRPSANSWCRGKTENQKLEDQTGNPVRQSFLLAGFKSEHTVRLRPDRRMTLLNPASTLASRKPLFAPTPDEPIVEHSVFYATCQGWQVFPVPVDTKKSHKSAERSGGRPWGATTDQNEIRRDFEKWPNANVGIVTGAVSDIFVLEADTKDGHDVDGLASLMALEQEHGALPATLQAESPSGSVHYYFKHPGFDIKNSASAVAPGVDVRGDGGMVVAPPSVKPGKGVYRWRNKLAIAEAPQWLLDKIVAGKEKPELTISQQALATV